MKKLILLCVLLMGCTADPLPQVIEVPATQPDEGYLIVEYIDLKLENEKLIQELNDANTEMERLQEDKDFWYEEFKEKRDHYYDYRDVVYYLLSYLPEDQRKVMFCDRWEGIIVRSLDTGEIDRCLNIRKMIDYVKELDNGRYPFSHYPDFYQFPVYDESMQCTHYCENIIVEQDTRP